MDKIVLEVKPLKNKKIEYEDYEIEIIPFLNLSQQAFLIEHYLKDYFGTPDVLLIENTRYHFLEAELNMQNYIFQLCTNIETKDIDTDLFMDMNLWGKITSEIKNYHDFKMTLDKIVDDYKQKDTLENSVGKVIDDVVQKAYALIERFASLNPDEIKQAGEQGLQLMEKLEKTSIFNTEDKNKIAERTIEGNTVEPTPKKKRTRTKKTQ